MMNEFNVVEFVIDGLIVLIINWFKFWVIMEICL